MVWHQTWDRAETNTRLDFLCFNLQLLTLIADTWNFVLTCNLKTDLFRWFCDLNCRLLSVLLNRSHLSQSVISQLQIHKCYQGRRWVDYEVKASFCPWAVEENEKQQTWVWPLLVCGSKESMKLPFRLWGARTTFTHFSHSLKLLLNWGPQGAD